MDQKCEATRTTFTWLHLTDLHVGMKDQDWMWPRLKDRFYQDLTRLHFTTGNWDLVIFSGDMTQRGSREDFNHLDTILGDIWQHFKELGCSPKLILMPGNHDLAWPAMTAQYRTLKRWWDDEEVRDEFFAKQDNEYTQAVAKTFVEYDAWVDRFANGHDFLLRGIKGLLSGDQSIMIEENGIKVGIVALNSTWLQLDGEDYQGRLHVDVRQLLSVTGGEPDKWLKQNDLNLLVTHHPTNWLHKSSLELWNNEIFPPGRFDAHLFGHMHEPSAWSTAFGGGHQRISLQGASTCGLKYVNKNSLERIHGYSVVRYGVDKGQRFLKTWPRRLHRLGDGSMSFNADVSFPIEQDNAYVIPLSDRNHITDAVHEIVPEEASLSSIPQDPTYSEVLREITFQLPQLSGHANVRRIEQRRFIENLTEDRACWLISEWGMGGDGFLASASKQFAVPFEPLHRLDLSDYTTQLAFFDSIVRQLNCTFERLCQLLSAVGECGLLLDNIPPDTANVAEIENIVSVILEYCPQLRVILRSRLKPTGIRLGSVHLSALDKADLISYISDHEFYDRSYISAEAIGRLHTHTDGIPSRVDRALKELQVVSLSDLVNSDAEVLSGAVSPEIPETLALAIGQFATSKDDTLSRSFGLLKVLSLFPQGESLARIKHFYSTKPFFPVHATELRDQGLIDTVTTQRLDAAGEETSPKILMVPRLAREGVRKTLQEDEVFQLNRRAAELYFGVNWSAGTYKPPPAYRFDKPHCNIADLGNGNVIIIRLLRESGAIADHQLTERVLGLAVSHLTALVRGNHYQSASIFCDDVLSVIVSDDHEEKVAQIKYYYALSLRMSGYHTKAREIIEEIREVDFSSDKKENLLLNLALVHQSLGENEDSERVAKEVVKLDRNSFSGLQAQALLIEFDEENPKQEEKLANLESFCRRRNATVVANNIALLRARKAGIDSAKVREILQPVLTSKGSIEDYYNKSRAVIAMAEHSLKQDVRLTDRELSNLVAVYHFVYNERFPRLFDRSHDALWRAFRANGDTANLFSLFRHSSLHWRLRGMEEKEKSYLQKLVSIVGDSVSKRLASLSQEVAYYLIRVSSQLTEKLTGGASVKPD